MSDKHATQKSKYTLDRQIPGAFEGETITRRRFMTGTANGAGLIAALSFTLPALGLALGPIFKTTPHRWETVGTVDQFPEDNYVPVVVTLTPGIGEAGKGRGSQRARVDDANSQMRDTLLYATSCISSNHLSCVGDVAHLAFDCTTKGSEGRDYIWHPMRGRDRFRACGNASRLDTSCQGDVKYLFPLARRHLVVAPLFPHPSCS